MTLNASLGVCLLSVVEKKVAARKFVWWRVLSRVVCVVNRKPNLVFYFGFSDDVLFLSVCLRKKRPKPTDSFVFSLILLRLAPNRNWSTFRSKPKNRPSNFSFPVHNTGDSCHVYTVTKSKRLIIATSVDISCTNSNCWIYCTAGTMRKIYRDHSKPRIQNPSGTRVLHCSSDQNNHDFGIIKRLWQGRACDERVVRTAP